MKKCPKSLLSPFVGVGAYGVDMLQQLCNLQGILIHQQVNLCPGEIFMQPIDQGGCQKNIAIGSTDDYENAFTHGNPYRVLLLS